MSELSKLTGAGNTTALPGYTLSPPGLRELGEAESEFARDYIASVAAGAKSADPEVRKELLAAATERVANSHFNYYGPGYRLCCLSARHLPFLLWLVARIESPKLTREQAKELITRDNEGDVSNAVLEALGFDTRPNVKAEKPESTPTSPSTGTPGGASSDSSATNENSTTTKSAA